MTDPQDAANVSARPTIAVSTNASPDESPLSEAQFATLRQAAAARRPIRRAAGTARVSAVTTLIIGMLAMPLAVVSMHPFTLLVVAGVCAIGVFEFIGSNKMRRGDLSAAFFLGRNQVVFLGLIVVYCIGQMIRLSATDVSAALGAGGASDAAVLREAGVDVQGLADMFYILMYVMYGVVILLSVGFQGGLALYYFTRRSHLQALAHHEPAWIQRLFAEVGA